MNIFQNNFTEQNLKIGKDWLNHFVADDREKFDFISHTSYILWKERMKGVSWFSIKETDATQTEFQN